MNSKLRQLKNKFLAWAIKWANMDDYTEEIPFDLPEVVNVLQALGFQLREAYNLDVKDLSLRNGEKGIKVVLTCVHSGQICHLEKPTDDKSCKCIPISDDNARDGFWEVSATKPSNNQSGTILETGSDLIPPLSKEMALLVNGITNQTFKIMKNENHFGSTQSLNKSFLGSPGKSLSKSFDLPTFMVTSPVSQSKKPIRYGSLDAIPSTYSSTNNMISKQLNLSKTELVPESYQIEACSTKDFQSENEFLQLNECFPLIERAHSDLSKVIERMRRCNFDDTSCIPICESTSNETTDSVSAKAILESLPQNPVPASSSKLVTKSKSGVSVSKPVSYTPRTSSSPSMTGITSKLKKPQVRSVTKVETPKEKLQESVKMAKLNPSSVKAKDTPTRISKYAHVKSTIPKPTPLKKK